MRSFIKKLKEEFIKTFKKPGRVSLLFSKKIRLRFFHYLKANENWEQTPEGVQSKKYRNYQTYLHHQRSKLDTLDLATYDQEFSKTLLARLREDPQIKPGMNVLCLAARLGSEVKAFHQLGCFAVGIDLNPGKNNKYVVYGDFHQLQFPDASVDIIYTNSLDHVFHIENVITEMLRVLKPGGLLCIEPVNGQQEGTKPGLYESFYWEKIDNLLALFTQRGFQTISRKRIDYPWQGEHCLLAKKMEQAISI